MTKETKQRIAFKAVIAKDDKVLILREANTYAEGTNRGRYHFPGGRLEPGEAWEDGLRREVKEETGLEIEIGKPLFVGEWRPVIKGVPHQIIALFVICTPISDDITLSEEHDHYEWVDADSWCELDVMVPDDEVLKAFFEQA